MNDKVNFRMCVCCRQRLHKDELKRIYFDKNKINFDKTKKSGFKGAYICSRECYLKALKTGRLAKALKCTANTEEFLKLESVLFDLQ